MSENTTTTASRENWLNMAVDAYRPKFEEVGAKLPEKIRVSVGFPHTGVKGENASILAITYASQASTDGTVEIFITPFEDCAEKVIGYLIHELIHASDDCASGHKGHFAEAATRLGLEGPMTAAVPGPALEAELILLALEFGPYPHHAMDKELFTRSRTGDRVPVPSGAPERRTSSGPRQQSARMIRIECPADGYTVRTTRKWLAIGSPSCPCGMEMVEK